MIKNRKNAGLSPGRLLSLSSGQIRKLVLFMLVIGLFLNPSPMCAQYTKLLDLGSQAAGANPYSTPVSDGTFLYGMTANGGANNLGTIYKIKLDGTGFIKLLDFDGTNGSYPYGDLYFDGVYLYGMTSQGGLNNYGLLFKIKPDGTGYVDLLDFEYTSTSGAYPFGAVISDGSFLYGMTLRGGAAGFGTIFKIQPDGSGYTNLFNFDYPNGQNPYGSLYLKGSALYGLTTFGGANGGGTLFRINTNGTNYTIYYEFSGGQAKGSLISDGSFLYGMTRNSGAYNTGMIFKISLDGSSGLISLYDFQLGLYGGYPLGSLVYDGSYLYGMTTESVPNNYYGSVFRIATDGSGFTKLLDMDLLTNGSNPQGTLLWDGATTLYGVRSGIDTSVSGISYLGTLFKVNTDGNNYTKLINYESTGNSPEGSFVAIGTTLYATTFVGGIYNSGTLFKINADGAGYAKVLDFDGTTRGSFPHGPLIYDGTYLYGTTTQGGVTGSGIVFRVKPDGSGFADLHDFDLNGGDPRGALLYDGTYLYGMSSRGGASGNGNVFKLLPDGTGYTNLIDLDYTLNGANPFGSLIDVAGVLYGLTSAGGANDAGALFKINKDGSGFTKLIDFDYTNTGNTPYESLYFDGSFLYGTTSAGGANGNGTIFKVKPDGSGFVTLLDFDGTTKGSTPKGSLISDDGIMLYGMTSSGGALGYGTAFQIKTDGTGFVKLFDFIDGRNPQRSFISDGTFLYGMTEKGGDNGLGTAFKITKTSFLSIISFNPGMGAVGTSVTIQGTNFDPIASNNVVKFNNVTAIVKSSTASTIVAYVPVGATSGPISITAGTTGTSLTDFTVLNNSYMIDGLVQSCNFQFKEPSGTNGITETFLPVNPGDKIQVSFSSFFAPHDQLKVYDGPTTSSPLITTLQGISLPSTIVATGVGGELTFEFLWGDGINSHWLANISCQSTGPTITINQQPVDFTACAGSLATFTTSATGTTNITYQWQYSPDGIVPFTDLANGGNYSNVTTTTLSVNTAGNFGVGRYRSKISGDLATSVYTFDEGLFINPTPAIPTVTNNSLCGPGTVTLTASGGSNGNYKWSDVNGVITGQTNSTYVTPALAVTTSYTVAITQGTCTSPPATVTATINPIPLVPSAPGVSGCVGNTATLTAAGGSNGNYQWSDVNGVIPGQTNSTYITPALAVTTSYTVAITQGTCTSPPVTVTATINPIPLAPTATGASACVGKTVVLTAAGGTNGTYRWYTTPSGGIAIAGEVNSTYTTPALIGSTPYYVSINNGTCESARTLVTATALVSGCSNPVITTTALTTLVGGQVTLKLLPLITTAGNNLDVNSIIVTVQPSSGAMATVSNGILTINYTGIPFSGDEQITIQACDTGGNCTKQSFTINVAGDIIVYNGVSPNGQNPSLIIENINLLPDTKDNTLYIFDRWQNQVWHGTNYNNASVVFNGTSDAGSELPSGVYYYKIDFVGGRKTVTGFISLKRQ